MEPTDDEIYEIYRGIDIKCMSVRSHMIAFGRALLEAHKKVMKMSKRIDKLVAEILATDLATPLEESSFGVPL